MVRAATIDDVPAIARLAARTFAMACPPTTASEAITAHIRDELNESRFAEHFAGSDFFVVDADDGEVCGYVMIAYDPPPVDNDWANPAELRRIYVDADRHSSGVAADLMRTSLDFAAQRGHDWIWLGTNEANDRAIRFYQKYGFQIVGKRTFCVAGSIECDHVLARPVR
ncbi:MAG: GNAT family N-acetyltransferase [Actinobacteria bacterium]|nr:GNAT family N-acetyltransferase [Actinomycetota bacterium]MCB8997727.1 GNAT family N-acetyltransferase [Actinomycetota bacterium]MCB9415504.1 GNAT family N-acetyltransferase [Actinomycetota bacterium]HRY10607.1 GNAT family N-acetyltransferase [Candidatus Nanopelagicales bacterium]